ncbi:MAG: STAS domain-containing protein [Pseudomonadota bacterium]|jgi:anti-anti-sigma regulatory factor|nr:STAS domain-containing protein [Pseudomonadota bacterium]
MNVRPRSKPARSTQRGRQAAVAAAPRGKSKRRNLLVLQAECTLTDAAELKSALCRLSDHDGTVTLDAAAVERIDTAALQLLAAFVRDRRLAGAALQWRAVSPAVHSAARLLGMDTMLALNEAAS